MEHHELDLRLAVGAIVAWLAVLACAGSSAERAITVALSAGLVGMVLVFMASRRCTTAWLRTIGLAGFATALVLVPLAGRLAVARASPVMRLARTHAHVEAVVTLTGDPRPLAARGVSGMPRVVVPAIVDSLVADGRRIEDEVHAVNAVVLAPAAGWQALLPGQRVDVDGVVQPSLDDALSVALFVQTPPALLGRPPWWQRAAGRVRTALQAASAVLPDPERGLLPGLIDGDTSHVDPVLAQRFRVAGLTHVIAVSGSNCSIAIGAVVLLLRRARARPWLVAVVGGCALVAFVAVARPSPSVVRAALMAAIALVALGLGRPRAALPALSGSVLLLLIWNPLLASDAGFAMSVLATTALLTIAPAWATVLRRRGIPGGVAELVAVAASAHVVTAPVAAAISGRVSLVAVIANVLVEPVVAVTTVLGFLAALVAPVWLSPGCVLAWMAGWPCRWLVRVADVLGGLHGATVPWPAGVAGGLSLLAASLALAVLLTVRAARPAVLAAVMVAVLVQIPVRTVVAAWPPKDWLFVACDVGQGDALVLNAGGHAAVVIDAGPEPVATDRCLGDLGVESIPIVFLTHFHLDHVGGLGGVLRGRRVGRLLTGPLFAPATGVAMVRALARTHQLAMSAAPAGATLRVGAVTLDVLGPAAPFHGTRSDPNNSSLVMRALVKGVRVLLSGDAEVEAQHALVQSGVDLSADVLKVWHHGSAYFDPAYLAAVHARIAVISVGAHNDYGHPSPLALQALARAGVPVTRTDQDGDVAVTAEHGGLHTVLRGTSASAVGLGDARRKDPGGTARHLADLLARTASAALESAMPVGRPARPAAVGLSSWNARMRVCLRARSPPTTCPAHCPARSCLSVTKSFSSSARSQRSLRLFALPSRMSSSPACSAARSRAVS